MKNVNDTIGKRTRNLPACSSVPQPTALPHAPVVLYRIVKYKQNIVKHNSVEDFIEVYSYIASFNDMFRL